MSNQILDGKIRSRIVEYLSESSIVQGFIGGAYVGRPAGSLIVEHDEGWSVLIGPRNGDARLLDYTPDQRFAGEAGLIALLDWLP